MEVGGAWVVSSVGANDIHCCCQGDGYLSDTSDGKLVHVTCTVFIDCPVMFVLTVSSTRQQRTSKGKVCQKWSETFKLSTPLSYSSSSPSSPPPPPPPPPVVPSLS